MEHATTAWIDHVQYSQANKIIILSQNSGGKMTFELARKFPQDFLTRVVAIKLADSEHTKNDIDNLEVPLHNSNQDNLGLIAHIVDITTNYIASLEPTGRNLTDVSKDDVIIKISSGHKDHRRTFQSSFHHIMADFDQIQKEDIVSQFAIQSDNQLQTEIDFDDDLFQSELKIESIQYTEGNQLVDYIEDLELPKTNETEHAPNAPVHDSFTDEEAILGIPTDWSNLKRTISQTETNKDFQSFMSPSKKTRIADEASLYSKSPEATPEKELAEPEESAADAADDALPSSPVKKLPIHVEAVQLLMSPKEPQTEELTDEEEDEVDQKDLTEGQSSDGEQGNLENKMNLNLTSQVEVSNKTSKTHTRLLALPSANEPTTTKELMDIEESADEEADDVAGPSGKPTMIPIVTPSKVVTQRHVTKTEGSYVDAVQSLMSPKEGPQIEVSTDEEEDEPDHIILDDQIMYNKKEPVLSLYPRPPVIRKAEPEDLDFAKIEEELRQAGHRSIFGIVSNQTSVSTPEMIKFLRNQRGITSRKASAKLDITDEIKPYLGPDLDNRMEEIDAKQIDELLSTPARLYPDADPTPSKVATLRHVTETEGSTDGEQVEGFENLMSPTKKRKVVDDASLCLNSPKETTIKELSEPENSVDVEANDSYTGNDPTFNHGSGDEDYHCTEKVQETGTDNDNEVKGVSGIDTLAVLSAKKEAAEWRDKMAKNYPKIKRIENLSDNIVFVDDVDDYETTLTKLHSRKTAKKGTPLDVVKETKKRQRSKPIVVDRDNPVFAVAANYTVEHEGYLHLPTEVMRDLSLTSNPITAVRNPTEPSIYLYRDITVNLKQAMKEIVKREFRKHFLSNKSATRLTNDGCEKYEHYGTKIKVGTTSELYRVKALSRQIFLHRELRAIIVQYLGDFNYGTLNWDQVPKNYTFTQVPEEEKAQNLPKKFQVPRFRQKKALIVKKFKGQQTESLPIKVQRKDKGALLRSPVVKTDCLKVTSTFSPTNLIQNDKAANQETEVAYSLEDDSPNNKPFKSGKSDTQMDDNDTFNSTQAKEGDKEADHDNHEKEEFVERVEDYSPTIGPFESGNINTQTHSNMAQPEVNLKDSNVAVSEKIIPKLYSTNVQVDLKKKETDTLPVKSNEPSCETRKKSTKTFDALQQKLQNFGFKLCKKQRKYPDGTQIIKHLVTINKTCLCLQIPIKQ